MPTIHSEHGFRFIIYPNDHEPAHVHVWKAGTEAKIQMLSEPELLEVSGMRQKDAFRALDIVEEHQQEFLMKWEQYHGHVEQD